MPEQPENTLKDLVKVIVDTAYILPKCASTSGIKKNSKSSKYLYIALYNLKQAYENIELAIKANK